MKILSDGSVIQSKFEVQGPPVAYDLYRKDYSLKQGIVQSIYYPEEKENVSKKYIEYDVFVLEERGDGSASTVIYPRCLTVDRFGTANNFERFTYQPAVKKDQQVYKQGAQVLLLTINGYTLPNRSIIIGGFSYPVNSQYKKEDGQFYEWQFNGVNIKVNKDGEYHLTFNTPIDPDGKKKDEKAAGTKIQILKDGKLKISDNEKQSWEIDRVAQKSTWTNGAESIIIDKKNKKIELISSGEIFEKAEKEKTTKTGKDYKVDAGGSVEEKAGKDIKMEAGGNIQQKAATNWQFEAGANITIKAGANVTIEGGGQLQLKGMMTMIGAGNTPVAGVGISQCMGIGNQGAPVMSNIITGSATVFVGA